MYCGPRIPVHPRCTQCSILLHIMSLIRSPYYTDFGNVFTTESTSTAVGEFGSRFSRSGLRRFMVSDDKYNI